MISTSILVKLLVGVVLLTAVFGAPPSSNSTSHKKPSTPKPKTVGGNPANLSAGAKVNSTRVKREQSEILGQTQFNIRNNQPNNQRATPTQNRTIIPTNHRQIPADDSEGVDTGSLPPTSHDSTHNTKPLFANRQSSNITQGLRPKLRNPNDQTTSEEGHQPHPFKINSEEESSSVHATSSGFKATNNSTLGGNKRRVQQKQPQEEDQQLHF